MDRIFSYIEGHDFESFQKNCMLKDAVVRNFEIIGEAAKKIPTEVQERNSALPWKNMYQLKNIISHGYFEIDYDTVWEIATKDLPNNFSVLKAVLEKEIRNPL